MISTSMNKGNTSCMKEAVNQVFNHACKHNVKISGVKVSITNDASGHKQRFCDACVIEYAGLCHGDKCICNKCINKGVKLCE